MSEISLPKRLPSILLALVVSLLVAAVFLGFQSCQTDAVLTPAEKQQVDTLQTGIDEQHAQVGALEDEARAAGGEFMQAMKTGDAEAQSAALQHFEDARGRWVAVVQSLQTQIAQQDEIISAAQQRAAEPFKAAASLTGIPQGWIDLAAGLALPFVFDRSRKALLNTLQTRLKQGLLATLGAPFEAYFRAYGLAHSSTTTEQALDTAANIARKKGDTDVEMRVRAVNGEATAIGGAPIITELVAPAGG